MTRRKRNLLMGAAIAAALAMVAAPTFAYAQDTQVESEIIVTATKRATTIQDVPFSVNAQTAEDIQRSNAANLEDLSRNVAGLAVQNLGPGQSQVSIRGVSAGQIVRDQPGVKEQVGIYLDESVISLSLFTPDLDLFDLNRVETLRGPQGTLFGSGSVGGTIRYITNQPDPSAFSGALEGNVNTLTDGDTGGFLKGYVNVPLSDSAAVRVVAYHTEYAGFIDALHPDGSRTEDINSGERSGARVALVLQPTASLTITPRVVYQKTHADGFNRREVFNLYANPFTTPATQFGQREQFLLLDEEFDDETLIGDLTANLHLDAVDITSVTSYIDRSILVSRDASALTGSVSADLAFAPAAVFLPSNLRDTTDLQQFTQELRVSSNYTGPLQWIVGAFYADIDRTYHQRLPTPGYDAATDAHFGAGTAAGAANGFGPNSPYNSDLPYTIKQTAVFGEVSYDFTDALTATFGARYYDFSEDRRFHSGGVFSNGDDQTNSTESDGVSPRLLIAYEATPNWTLNAQVSKGFRLGGANDPLNLPLCDDGVPNGPDAQTFGGFPVFEDETLWNYEAGAKYFGHGISFSGALYHTRIENLQVSADAGSCSSRVVFNVPHAHTTGLEAEMTATPIDGLEVSLAASRVESEFDSSLLDTNGDVIAGIRRGNKLPSTPQYQYAATAAYYFPISVFGLNEGFVGGSIQRIGSRYTQPGDQEAGAGVFSSGVALNGATGAEQTVLNLHLNAYTSINLNAGIRNEDWSITAYVTNLTDENASLSFDRERGGRARLGFEVTNPRTIGITVRRNF